MQNICPFTLALAVPALALGQVVSPLPVVEQPKDPDAARCRAVAVDTGSIWAAAVVGGAVTLNLFDDAPFTLSVDRRWDRPEGFSIAGRTADGGSFSLAVEQGHLSATIRTRAGAYGLVPSGALTPGGQAVCEARQLTAAAASNRCLPTDATLAARPPGGAPVPPPARSPREGDANQPLSFGAPPPTGACDCGDDQSAVDLLAVYTPAALAGAGGLSALTARLQDGIAEANLAFDNSAITAGGPVNRLDIRLAGVQQIAYDEAAPNWLDHLDRVTGTADGYMDNVHAMRDAAKADLVSLIVEDGRFTGGAAFYAVYSDASAFSVLNWRALGGGSYTLAHELGHNFGCAHDRGNSTFAPFRYAWGYSFSAGAPAATYGTIMSYTGANLVNAYSNPFVTHAPTGHALGTPLADPLATDNALAIATTRWTIASYRDAAGIRDCNGNGVDDAADIASGTSQDANGNCRPDECEQRVYVDAGNTGVVDGLSWNTAWTSLADALAFASMKCSNVSEIWVADGAYRPDAGGATDGANSRYAKFQVRSGLAVIGGFQGKSRPGGGETSISQRVPGAFPSILTGDVGAPGVDTDNVYNVVWAENTDATAVLDGFTIERGFTDGDGAGLYVRDSSVTVRNCTFRNNRAGGGGGLAVTGALSSPTLTGCLFHNNSAANGGAFALRDNAGITLEASTVRNCSADYGGVCTVYFGSHAVVRSCTLEDNTALHNSGACDLYVTASLAVEDSLVQRNSAGDGGGGAFGVYNGSTLTIDRCTVRQNQARWGGAATSFNSALTIRRSTLESNQATGGNGGAIDHYTSQPTVIHNSVIRSNTASDGGGAISQAFGTVSAVNCTLYGNHAANAGGGLTVYDGALTLNNSILYANTTTAAQPILDKQITLFFNGQRTVNASCVQGLAGQLGGSGNIGADPSLVNAAAGDLTLSSSSPCIDAASNPLAPPGPALDRAGNPRFTDAPATADTGIGPAPVIDMGAYEFVPPPACPADLGVQGGTPGSDGHLDNNDFVVFIDYFFNHNPLADVGTQGGLPGHDGQWDNNDFVVYIDLFFDGCS